MYQRPEWSAGAGSFVNRKQGRSMKSLNDPLLSSPVFASECSPAPGLAGAGSLVFVGGKFLPGSATPVIGTIRDKNII